MEKGNPMKDGEQFDPGRAQYGDVFVYSPPGYRRAEVQLTYVGVAPYPRKCESVHLFQTATREAPIRTMRTSNIGELRFSTKLTHKLKSNTQQGEATMNETTTVKSILAGSRTVDPNIAAIMREDTRTVDVKLNGVSENLTYVTDLNLELDDLVVLPNKAGTGYNVGVVTGVHDDLQIPPNSEIVFKWVVSKLDLTAYKASMGRNATIEQAVSDAYQNNARRTVRAAVMAGMDDKAKRTLEAAISGTVSLAAPKE